MDPEVVDKYRDVFITSNTGKGYGINRSILAALSPFCRDLFLDLYKCPLANADDSIHISTNLTDEELDIIKDFFESGGKLPSTQDGKVKYPPPPKNSTGMEKRIMKFLLISCISFTPMIYAYANVKRFTPI